MPPLPPINRCKVMLAKCEGVFRFYAKNHRAKGTPESDEKAAHNEQFAYEIRTLLDDLA